MNGLIAVSENRQEGATIAKPDLGRSALLIIDMQNDFVHPKGHFGYCAQRAPDAGIDLPFLRNTIPQIKRLAAAFRKTARPVIYIANVVKADYSDAHFPYWRLGLPPPNDRTFIAEGTWGAQIVDELAPQEGEHLVIKKGFGAFANTALDTILRGIGVTTCVVTGVTTCVCVSTTIRMGVEYNYRMVLVRDGVADRNRENHEAEIRILSRAFADIATTDQIETTLFHQAIT
ncbi:MAG: cysteine hydrolase [Acetobacteraceae bacterium]|nr:cysteine hydrolase [Acetobacteraceae bacterium]